MHCPICGYFPCECWVCVGVSYGSWKSSQPSVVNIRKDPPTDDIEVELMRLADDGNPNILEM